MTNQWPALPSEGFVWVARAGRKGCDGVESSVWSVLSDRVGGARRDCLGRIGVGGEDGGGGGGVLSHCCLLGNIKVGTVDSG